MRVLTLLIFLICSDVWSQDTTYGGWQQLLPGAPVTEEPPPPPAVPPPPQIQSGVPGISPPRPVGPNDPLLTRHLPRGSQPCGRGRTAVEAPIWPRFTHTFTRCAPGCSPGVSGTFGCRAGRSCHPSGNAIDVHFLDCSGQRHGVQSAAFREFVNCMRETRYDGGGGRSQAWQVLFQETHNGRSRDCRGSSLQSDRRTICHWDHVHLDLGC